MSDVESLLTTKPVRLQLSRRKGFNLQDWSRRVNGLPAAVIARPSKWGNPYRVARALESEHFRIPAVTAAAAVALYREHLLGLLAVHESARASLAELRGKNLACWCAPDAPCHADALLELANAEERVTA